MAASSSRAFSPPPLSYGSPSTTGPTSSTTTIPSRIVHKLAIEGRCNAEDAGASLRLYMKIVLPLEGLVGGSSVPLFPEENVRIVTSKVQPLDSTSTPYAFSSSAVPLLHKAARALNLPARSNKSYYTFLGIPPPTQAPPTPLDPGSSRRAAAAAPLPLSVTGEINVSNFHICFILPRILPTRGAVLADNDEHPTSRHHRRASFVDGKTILFMAGVEIFVPFISCPPKAPYQLSLPLPRCLSNHIKLRVMPPVKKHGGHEPPPWDLTSDPLVTYKPSHGARSTSYEQLADDEVSLEDSVEAGAVSASSSGVQGTFPSAERIRVRWAAPMNRNQGLGVLADGRRRVGVDEAVGSMHCTILGRDEQERTKLRLEYEGTCKGLWFPGVATQVGLVVVLDGKGRHLSWASEDEKWEISGGNGLTGHDGSLPSLPPENSMIQPDTPSRISRPSLTTSRLSSYGGASLLQTALPNNSMLPDYSFETTPSPTVSMIDSSGTRYGQSSSSSGVLLPSAPDKEITLFLNIGDLPPPPHNEFNFKISGNILLGRLKDGDEDEEDGSQALPIFRVLPAEISRNEFIVTSEIHQGVEIIQPNDKRGHRPGMVNGLRTPQVRRKFLKKKSTVHADDGVRVLLSSVVPSSPTESPLSRFTATPRTPIRGSPLRSPRTPRTPGTRLSSPLAGGSHAIPWVRASVNLLPSSTQHSHAIQFSVPSVAATDGVLSFGVCLPTFLANDAEAAIDIVSAMADGMNLPVDVFPRAALEDDEKHDAEKFDRALRLVDYTSASGELVREQLGDRALRNIDTWVRISLPDDGGFGNIDVHYLVARDPKLRHKKTSRSEQLSILLPSFHLGVGTYTVDFHTPRGYKDPLVLSNFHQQEDGHLSHYRLPGYFNPGVRAQIEAQGDTSPSLPMRSLQATGWLLGRFLNMIPALASLVMLWIMITIREDIRDMQFFSNFSLGSSSWASQARNPPDDHGGNAQATTATFPYTVDTATATPYNNHPTGSGAEIDIAKQMYSLMPLPLAFLPRLDWARLADALLMSMEKLMGFFHAVIHFPTPP